jgi:hypothetical protein
MGNFAKIATHQTVISKVFKTGRLTRYDMLKDLSWECIESHWVVKTKMYELEELECLEFSMPDRPLLFADVLYWG